MSTTFYTVTNTTVPTYCMNSHFITPLNSSQQHLHNIDSFVLDVNFSMALLYRVSLFNLKKLTCTKEKSHLFPKSCCSLCHNYHRVICACSQICNVILCLCSEHFTVCCILVSSDFPLRSPREICYERDSQEVEQDVIV